MTIPESYKKDVLEDLASLYLAGEATAGTKMVLESYAGENPEFAARLQQAGSWEAPKPPAAVSKDAETQALLRTKEAIRMRTIFTAMGIAFTLLPCAFTFNERGIHMLFLPEQTGLVTAFWSLAAASWVATWVMHRAVFRRGL